ncbi:MAG: acyl-CoA thioesterase [Planctomycetota bacterium]
MTRTDTGMGQTGDRCSIELRVRYAECDAMGYLHHAKYWEYFEHVRTELLRQNGFRYRDLEAQGVCFVVFKAACKYIAPIRYDDLVEVSVKVESMTRTRVDHSYEIHSDGKLTCQASTTLACVGRDGRPRTMPEALWSGP